MEKILDKIWIIPPKVRHYGTVNYRGLLTLYRREMRRGFKIWGITLVAPAIRALLFACIFNLIIGDSNNLVLNLSYIQFLLPGLITIAILERSFESSSFSMVYDKTQGVFGDVSMAPLTPGELIIAYSAASVTGGLIVGIVVWFVLLPIGGQLPEEPLALIFFTTMGALNVGLLSQIVGLFTTKWDHLVGVQTFLFMPLVFLSGAFFSFDKLPSSIQPFARGNPIFYIVDGVRYGVTGYCDSDPLTGGVIILFCFIILLALTSLLFSRGFHLYR